MTVKELITRDEAPCERCGRIEDLTGEYPDGPLLCLECSGFLTCPCCGNRYFEGDTEPEGYVCQMCQEDCPYDAEGGECSWYRASEPSDCSCPKRPGAIPKNCPDCGACNHIDMEEHAPMADGSVLTCRDCGDRFQVWALAAE